MRFEFLHPGRQNRAKALGLPTWVVEPVCRPDTVESPTQAFENFLTETIPVTRRLGRMIACTVALHAQHEPVRPVGMPHADVDKISSHADLRHGLVSHRPNL